MQHAEVVSSQFCVLGASCASFAISGLALPLFDFFFVFAEVTLRTRKNNFLVHFIAMEITKQKNIMCFYLPFALK